MLRIPVCMHNVEDDKIFRPASWNASVWIRKVPTTELAQLTDLFINS